MLFSRKSKNWGLVFAASILSQNALATDFTSVFSGSTFTVTEADAPYDAGGDIPGNKLAGIYECDMILGDRVFQTQPFVTGGAGLHTIEIISTNPPPPEIDPFIALYSPSFDPANPSANLVTCNDDIVPYDNQLSRITPVLTAGSQYEVVVTTWDSLPGLNGSINWTILPDITLLPPNYIFENGFEGPSQ